MRLPTTCELRTGMGHWSLIVRVDVIQVGPLAREDYRTVAMQLNRDQATLLRDQLECLLRDTSDRPESEERP